MSATSNRSPAAPRWQKAEVRYSLRELLAEVVEERKAGPFGAEKLRQADINQLFEPKTRKSRAPRA
jgi:hypothetical protein